MAAPYQYLRRERAASDQAQTLMNLVPSATPVRPGPPARTTSAPAGGLFRLGRSNLPMDAGAKMGHAVIEEDEIPPTPDEEAARTPRAAKSSDDVTISSSPDRPYVTIAVVGGDGVGKTTFIRWALELRTASDSRVNTREIPVDGAVLVVRVLEIASRDVVVDEKRSLIVWPRFGEYSPRPAIDAVIVAHDATRPATLGENGILIDALHRSSIPYVLAACKCDLTSPTSQGSPTWRDTYRTSPKLPRSQRKCLVAALRLTSAGRYDRQSPVRPHRHPTGDSSLPQTQVRQYSTQDWHHARARSENPAAAAVPPGRDTASAGPAFDLGVVGGHVDRRRPSIDHLAGTSTTPGTAPSSRYVRSNSYPVRPQTPPSAVGVDLRRPPTSDSLNSSSSPSRDRHRQHRLHTAWRFSAGSDAFNSFLDIDDEMDQPTSAPASPEVSNASSNSTIPTSNTIPNRSSSVKDRGSSDGGVTVDTGPTFDELVDRLVSVPMSKQDSKFAAIFLCLYRKFAAPATLLGALVSRFERNERNSADQLTRMADQLRLLSAMAQWVSEYPGDFAYPKTRKKMADFVSTLEKSHFYMFAAKEIGSYLETNAKEDDVGWPFRDGNTEEFDPDRVETFFYTSGRSSPSAWLNGPVEYDEEYVEDSNEEQSQQPQQPQQPQQQPPPPPPPPQQQPRKQSQEEEDVAEEEEDPLYHSMGTLDIHEDTPDTSVRLSGTLTNSSAGKSSSTLNQSFTLMTIDSAQKEAATLELMPKFPITKTLWRQFMEVPDEEFARELTRMDWVMYNSFRPRDLVRHVSISGPEKEQVKSLQNVNRMIKQFNHLAYFVASMILFRDKPKHRAKALEKFMSIAQKLRRQNNYNSLGAVIAGINGTPVLRLSQTRELVPPAVQKDFMRLVILMGTQKSHFAYRLAWENSFSERIPFLPLHRRDLVSAEEGNRTFVGENKTRINWKKFEVMGEVVLGIQRSQQTPYTYLQKSEDVQRIVLESKLSGVEEVPYLSFFFPPLQVVICSRC
ncbi:hypothetical protein ASPZODRAFT_131338 [Penicilliopsis zonata CBS 506.65]|uniref:Ras-GEF domain-containing protein n=1 Tax=Penicilliopsis zonata CBS 506.65 TaxID=1073090 RepID=A0A1L9SKM3_9EURO|nr:hypothetical protein ASPZODRAFT_131338 [Penicilliopsis zonata CBS 506.65]OJJ47772.1 hypothetical protein ASPZODRAFT_131338 [Penicilliopsis zonata CBS 506.65]